MDTIRECHLQNKVRKNDMTDTRRAIMHTCGESELYGFGFGD